VLIRITVWQGLFSGFVTVWEIWKVVSTDCSAQRCSARHALAGIAIATMTSLRHRPTTDRGTDIATLVRRALAAVCTVPMLLVFLNGLLSQLIGFATVSADSGRSLKQNNEFDYNGHASANPHGYAHIRAYCEWPRAVHSTTDTRVAVVSNSLKTLATFTRTPVRTAFRAYGP